MEEHKVHVVFDKISPRLRSVVSVLLIGAGFLLQLSAKNLLVGMPFIILCLILNLVKGVAIKRVAPGKLNWQAVTPDKIEQVLTHCRKISKFRSQNFGCFISFIILVFVLGSFLFPFLSAISISFPLTATIVNAVILFSGLVLSGRRSAWMPYALDIKVEIVKRIVKSPVVENDPNLQAIPYLEIGETSQGSFPNDARVLIKFKEASEDFIGLQGQISINAVKSRKYPYFYVVLIARPKFNLLDKFRSSKTALNNITVERKKTEDVDVIVLRQHTTKTTGYHTDQKTQDRILLIGIEIAKGLI